MTDHPIEDVLRTAEARMREGWTIYQKFTCALCGARQTIDEPNQFFSHGKCEECSHVTDIRVTGCNILAIWTNKEDKAHA